jgi:hypothetical protein
VKELSAAFLRLGKRHIEPHSAKQLEQSGVDLRQNLAVKCDVNNAGTPWFS